MSGTWSSWVRRLRKEQQTADPSVQAEEAAPSEPSKADAIRTKAPAAKATLDAATSRPAAPKPGAPKPAARPLPDTASRDPASPNSAKPAGTPARLLLCQGKLTEARRIATSGGTAADRATKALAASIAEGETLLRAAGIGAANDGDAVLRGVMLAPCRGARQVVVVFGDDEGGFILPRAADLTRRPHLLFVQDPKHCLSLLGVERLGSTYDACLLAILRLVKHLGDPDLFCLGGGAGMYSALRYGLDLGAGGVLALGAITGLKAGQTVGGRRPAAVMTRLTAVAELLGADLEQAYAQAAQRPSLLLCWPQGAADPSSRVAALAGAGLTRAPARARPAPLAWADETGRLRGMVRALLKTQPVIRPQV